MNFSNINYNIISPYNKQAEFKSYNQKKNDAKLATNGVFNRGCINKKGEYDPLSQLFFSIENTKRIQKKIKKEIFERTKGKYRLREDQNELDLLVAMRAIYLDNAKFQKERLIKQVKLLNILVINYIVPDMITGIKSYYGYIDDINGPIKPIDRPLNVNNSGRLTLPSLTTAWNF
jgi:hypothetical protein